MKPKSEISTSVDMAGTSYNEMNLACLRTNRAPESENLYRRGSGESYSSSTYNNDSVDEADIQCACVLSNALFWRGRGKNNDSLLSSANEARVTPPARRGAT